jgi:hypothetical protein
MRPFLATLLLLTQSLPTLTQKIYGELHPSTPHVLGTTIHHQDNYFTQNCLFDCRALGPSCVSFAVYAALSTHPESEACYLFDLPTRAVIDTVLDKSHVNPIPFRTDPAWYLHSRGSFDSVTSTSTSTTYSSTSTISKSTPTASACGIKGNFHPDSPFILGSTGTHIGNHSSVACQHDCYNSFNNRCISFASHDTDSGITCTFFSVEVGAVFFTTIEGFVAENSLNPWTFYDDVCFTTDPNLPTQTTKASTKSMTSVLIPTGTQTGTPSCGVLGHIAHYDPNLDSGPWSKSTLTMRVADINVCLNECHNPRVPIPSNPCASWGYERTANGGGKCYFFNRPTSEVIFDVDKDPGELPGGNTLAFFDAACQNSLSPTFAGVVPPPVVTSTLVGNGFVGGNGTTTQTQMASPVPFVGAASKGDVRLMGPAGLFGVLGLLLGL